MIRTFRKGSSTFNCRCCGRLTRDTTGNGLDLCVHCEEIAGHENEVHDGCRTEEEGRALIAALLADLRATHGDAIADKAAACTDFA